MKNVEIRSLITRIKDGKLLDRSEQLMLLSELLKTNNRFIEFKKQRSSDDPGARPSRRPGKDGPQESSTQ